MMAFGCGAFGKWLGHEDGDLMNESDTIIKEILESSLFPSTMWGYRENTAIWEQERGPSPQIESASTLILDFPDSRTREVNPYCLSHSDHHVLLQQPRQTKTNA